MVTDFYKNINVVVTGGRGFVGSFLVDFLLDCGANVTVMDTGIRGKNHNPYAHYCDPRQADVTMQGNCEAVFAKADVVFNLAAYVGGLYYNITHQAQQFWGNMNTVVPPALAAAKVGVPVFYQMSTVCVYAPGFNDPAEERWGHMREPEPGNAGYAWAKRLGERICDWAFEGTDTRYMVGRATNIYGIRDHFDDTAHVIPALIRKLTDGRDVVDVWGGDQRREFLYVEDAARGILALAEKGECGEAYNLGTYGDTQVSIRELAIMLQTLTDFNGSIHFIEDAPTGDRSRSTDCSKIRCLGWKHEVDLGEGLRRTVEWWKQQ